MRAWGKIGSILPALKPLDLGRPAFVKAISLHYEMMFARGISSYDLETQGRILSDVARLIDDGTLDSIVTQQEVFGTKTLRAAHELIESGKAIGKITFSIPAEFQ
jgi:NADPH2:quinone reductase